MGKQRRLTFVEPLVYARLDAYLLNMITIYLLRNLWNSYSLGRLGNMGKIAQTAEVKHTMNVEPQTCLPDPLAREEPKAASPALLPSCTPYPTLQSLTPQLP